MKKHAILLLAAILAFASALPARAVELSARGQWVFLFDCGQNGRFTGGNGMTGFGPEGDEFGASQRVRLQLDARASDALSGTAQIEIGNQKWGNAAQGASMGADGAVVELKNAHLDWIIPGAGVRTRMGIQTVILPSFTTSSQILAADLAGIVASRTFNDNVSLSAFWLRPWNDGFAGTADGRSAGFMDNVDLFALSLPLSFDGLKMTPWAMHGILGPNAFRHARSDGGDDWLPAGVSYYTANLFPLYGSARHESLTGWGGVWWAGFTGEITAFSPLRVAWDANYGSFRRDDASSCRSGWLISALAEHDTGAGVFGVHGWYASGDDDSPANGSERMPYASIDDGSLESFGRLAFGSGRPNTFRDARIAHSMAGTWGVGLRARKLSLVDGLTHLIHVNYVGGTNDPGLLKKLARRHGEWMAPNATMIGKEGLYLTRNDGVLEINVCNDLRLHDSLKITLDASYLRLFLDHDDAVWGRSRMNGRDDTARDVWNVTLSALWSF